MRFGRVTVGAVAVALVGSATGLIVAEKMQLTPAMKNTEFSSVTLIPIDFTVGVQTMKPTTATEAVRMNSGSVGSIVFAVRRPG